MTYAMWLVGIIVAIQLTGCAGLRALTGSADERFAYWLDRQEYGKASAVIAETKASPGPAIGDLQALQERLDARVAAVEREAIATADAAADTNDWAMAFDVYRTALSRLPESWRLIHGHQRLQQRHAEYLERLELERLIAKGEWMLKDLEVTKLAEATDSDDWFGQFALSRKSAGADSLSLELAEHGQRAFERRDLTLARHLASLAASLSQTAENRRSLTPLHEALLKEESRSREDKQPIATVPVATPPIPPKLHKDKARSAIAPHTPMSETSLATPATAAEQPAEQPANAEHAATPRQEQKRAKQLMADFRKACREKDLAEAHRLRTQLEELQIDDREFEQLSAKLASDIAKHVKHLIAVGAAHYSQQQYADAMQVWRQAYALDPNNEQLNTRLKRVARVLDKLQRLRDKSAAPP